ncbi:hypothetical protein VTL71DRAFT_11429 [Oculimacula yallundae]|uniref:Uncharacterized protein n=1 Tax=Oculimacula yallundae TaxID=86028 RepID=A0ABR4CQ54_9HELO
MNEKIAAHEAKVRALEKELEIAKRERLQEIIMKERFVESRSESIFEPLEIYEFLDFNTTDPNIQWGDVCAIEAIDKLLDNMHHINGSSHWRAELEWNVQAWYAEMEAEAAIQDERLSYDLELELRHLGSLLIKERQCETSHPKHSHD